MNAPPHSAPTLTDGYLDGHLLVAMPSISDPRFARSVIYLCAHSEEGAMGLIVNQKAAGLSFAQLLAQLDLADSDADLPRAVAEMAVHVGGPVETGRGFVLHSNDYFIADSTLPIDADVCLTATIDILKAIAAGTGPERLLLALGYAAWTPGQLEEELRGNGWLVCPADAELVFGRADGQKYAKAMARIGIDPSYLVADIGNA